MERERYVFSQIVDVVPQRQFKRMVDRIADDRTKDWVLSYWNQLLFLMFGQLNGDHTMKELAFVVQAHS